MQISRYTSLPSWPKRKKRSCIIRKCICEFFILSLVTRLHYTLTLHPSWINVGWYLFVLQHSCSPAGSNTFLQNIFRKDWVLGCFRQLLIGLISSSPASDIPDFLCQGQPIQIQSVCVQYYAYKAKSNLLRIVWTDPLQLSLVDGLLFCFLFCPVHTTFFCTFVNMILF